MHGEPMSGTLWWLSGRRAASWAMSRRSSTAARARRLRVFTRRAPNPAVTLAVRSGGARMLPAARRLFEKVETLRGRWCPADVHLDRHPQLRRNRAEKVERTAVAHADRSPLGRRAHLDCRWAGAKRRRVDRDPGDPGADAVRVLFLRLHAEPHHAVCADLSIGILVDDAIVVVENIVRHASMPENRGRPLAAVAVEAVDEVGNPTILATLAVIAAILPMAFVGGLMGPYMRPIPIGASAAMVFSLMVAFVVTPWAAVRLLKPAATSCPCQRGRIHAALPSRHGPLLRARRASAGLPGRHCRCCCWLRGACSAQLVTVKMLPSTTRASSR